jgi:hypothetical protein
MTLYQVMSRKVTGYGDDGGSVPGRDISTRFDVNSKLVSSVL